MKVLLLGFLNILLPNVEGMNRRVGQPDMIRSDECKSDDECESDDKSKGSRRNSDCTNSPRESDENFERGLEMAARMSLGAMRAFGENVQINPYVARPPRPNNPLAPRTSRSRSPLARNSQTGSAIVDLDNVTGGHLSKRFAQKSNRTSSASGENRRSRDPLSLTLPHKGSAPSLFLQQKTELEPRINSALLNRDSLALATILEKFQKLGVSNEEQSFEPGDPQPLHIACAASIEEQVSRPGAHLPLHIACAASIEEQVSRSSSTTVQGLQQLDPSIQPSGVTVDPNKFRSVVKSGLKVLEHVCKVLNGVRVQRFNRSTPESLVDLLDCVATSFRSIERDPYYEMVREKVAVDMMSRMTMRVEELAKEVQQAIEQHGAGKNFDLGKRLTSLLVSDIQYWSDALQQLLPEV